VTLTAPVEQASLLPEAPGAQVFTRDAGRVALPTRLMVGLHFLKHAFSCSDGDVCEMWKQNPYWQAFTGETHLQWSLPCDPSSLTRWRKRVDEAGVEIALAATIASAKQIGMVREASFARVVVDTTVQEKAIAHPVDSRLFDRAREKLVRLCERHDIALRQSYRRIGPKLRRRASGYGHAKQYKRMRAVVRKLKTLLGRVYRDVERKLGDASEGTQQAFAELMKRVKQLLAQGHTGPDKLYALHAPEAECISKGKAHKRYEFGVKVGIAITATEGLVVGARSFPGRPYDGHTLHEQLEQVESLTGSRPEIVVADRGYRGAELPEGTTLKHSGLWANAKRSLRTLLRRRQSIEPHLGHMKSDGLLGRNYLKGALGDAMNAVLAGAGHNIRLILNHLALAA
jgi:transposase, IS5 family